LSLFENTLIIFGGMYDKEYIHDDLVLIDIGEN